METEVAHHRGRPHKNRTFVTCLIIIFLLSLLGAVMSTPVLKLFESSVCRFHYSNETSISLPDGNIPEEFCKIPPVQIEVAFINTCIGVITSSISIFSAIPFGILADRYGRRLVLALNTGAEVLFYATIVTLGYFNTIFPPRAFIFTGLYQLMGGGGRVVNAMLYSLLTDISEPENRATLFYYLEISDYITQFIGPPLAAWTMSFSIWTAFGVGIGISFLSFVFALFLENKVPGSNCNSEISDASAPLLAAEEEQEGQDNDISANTARTKTTYSQIYTSLQAAAVDIINLLSAKIWQPLLALALASCARMVTGLLQQYASEKFLWPISQTTYLLSARALVDLALFSLLLPRIQKYYKNDLAISWESGLLATLACLAVGVSSNPIPFSGGKY
ncbi:hypothetical protein AA313_de0206780 [Arthrobotrys entomopaga]|nr:hypothetical protein AA313_de0206780 [Arthrobotrys entomopaga]